MSELPKGWARCELRECVDVLDSRRVPINSDERGNRQGSVPYYGATGQVGWIDNYLFNEELLLIGEDGAPFFDKSKPIAYIIRGKSWVNNHAHVLRAKNNLTSNLYLKHFLDFFDFNDFVNGTTRLKLTQGKMNEMPVCLAPLNEQRRIVAKLEKILHRVDACKERLDKIPAILNRFRRSVLSAACSGRLTSDWRQSHHLEFDETWKSRDFFDFIVLQRGYDLVLANIEKGDFPVVTSAGIEKYHSSMKVKGPGVVTGRSGSVGKVYYVQNDFWPHNTVLYVRDFKGNDPKYVYFFLLGFDTREYSASTAVPTLNRNNLRGIEVLVPPLPEQQEIVRRVEALFKKADAIEVRYQKAKAFVNKLTQSILAKAFRGELVPQDPNDEPASVLLERIRAEKEKNQKKVVSIKDRMKKKYKPVIPSDLPMVAEKKASYGNKPKKKK